MVTQWFLDGGVDATAVEEHANESARSILSVKPDNLPDIVYTIRLGPQTGQSIWIIQRGVRSAAVKKSVVRAIGEVNPNDLTVIVDSPEDRLERLVLCMCSSLYSLPQLAVRHEALRCPRIFLLVIYRQDLRHDGARHQVRFRFSPSEEQQNAARTARAKSRSRPPRLDFSPPNPRFL